jgi:hypothetical protein
LTKELEMRKFLKLEEAGDGTQGGGGGSGPDAETVDKAKQLGWVPKEQFKGRETEWVDADEFVRRGEQILPIVKDNLRRVQAELKKANTQIAQFGQTAEEFRKFTEEAQQRKEAEWARELDALKAQLAKAVEDGDGKATTRLMDEIEEHKGGKPTAPAKTQQPQVDPAYETWEAENPWMQDPGLREVAIAKGIYLNKKEGLVGPALYAAVKKEMVKMFPEEVQGDTGGDNGGMFDDPGSSKRRTGNTGRTKEKTYENLPPEAKAACDKFLAKGFIKSKEQYVKNYDWSAE